MTKAAYVYVMLVGSLCKQYNKIFILIVLGFNIYEREYFPRKEYRVTDVSGVDCGK